MRLTGRIRAALLPVGTVSSRLGLTRDRVAVLLAVATIACVVGAFFLSKGTQLLMPGPLASAHGAIENCDACHTKSGSGKLSWMRGLVAADPHDDSKACLTCHKMSDTAFNAHGASSEMLKQSTERLTKIAAQTPQPRSARAQEIAFPTHDMVADGLHCATCHQEHKGVNFNLSKISNEQCRSCHVVKFDSFDGQHPNFESYPFKRRTRIIFDHAGHFGKHYPEVAKKDPAKRIPATCSTCHNSSENRRVMAVAPFEQTCTSCHLDQIAGKERVSGPKGIAFLSLPGLDVQTLKKKNAEIGEWPESSEAELTPFMKVMISRHERGRDLIKRVDGLNLQELGSATDDQIKAVTSLVWEIKGLFHALIAGKASDVLGSFTIGGGATLSANLVTDLTASIPRDVLISAQQQWLANLGKEMASRPATGEPSHDGWDTVTTEIKLAGSASPEELFGPKAPPAAPRLAPKTTAEREEEILVAEEQDSAIPEGGAITGRWSLPSGTPRSLRSRSQDGETADEPDGASGKSDAAGATTSTAKDAGKSTPSEGAAGKADTANTKAESGNGASAPEPPQEASSTEQTDDLLFPTEAELRAMKSGGSGTETASEPAGGAANTGAANAKAPSAASDGGAANPEAPADTATAAAAPPAPAPVISIDSDVDPESWAEYGGWYRQDYAIFYRPTGHKDKFIYSWLVLTGPHAPRDGKGPDAAVFDALTNKDAQGSCTKCHSVDDVAGKGRLVNFSPPSADTKKGRFTNFVHEPHFGVLEKRGCEACHKLEKDRPYLKNYEHGNPLNFVSSFGTVDKQLCQTCHTSTMARQDCLLCHDYHVNGVVTPMMSTKLPLAGGGEAERAKP